MPRTETIVRTLFKFDELSEEAQEKVIENNWDWNIDCDWWDSTYEDAASIGLEITAFDLGRRQSIDGKLTEYFLDCCKLIRKNHGKDCDTFKTADIFLTDYIEAFKKWLAAKDREDMEDWELAYTPKDWLFDFPSEDEAVEVENDFRKALLEDYHSILDREYDYQTSREAIVESIQCNEMEFTESGSPA